MTKPKVYTLARQIAYPIISNDCNNPLRFITISSSCQGEDLKQRLPFLLNTVKPRPEAHMDMILFEVFLKSIDLIPQQQILQRHYLYYR